MMHNTRVFNYLQQFISKEKVEEISNKYGGERYIKKFTSWAHLWVMLFAHLNYRESLNHIVQGFFSCKERAKSAGLLSLSDSRLSEANSERSEKIFEEVFHNLLFSYQKLVRKRGSATKKLLKKVCIIDSTIVTVSRKLSPWAIYKRARDQRDIGGVKLHILYDLFLACPRGLKVTTANVHDVNKNAQFSFKKAFMYVFDRGYFNYSLFLKIINSGAYFVTRWKKLGKYSVIENRKLTDWQKKHGVISDQIVQIGKGTKQMDVHLRLVVYQDEEGHKYKFLTNRFELSPCTIATLYRYRWEIETFFKWIKQHLKIKHFFGYSDNAIKIQIWTALIAYLLLQITKILSNFNGSLLEWARRLADIIALPISVEPRLITQTFVNGIQRFQLSYCMPKGRV